MLKCKKLIIKSIKRFAVQCQLSVLVSHYYFGVTFTMVRACPIHCKRHGLDPTLVPVHGCPLSKWQHLGTRFEGKSYLRGGKASPKVRLRVRASLARCSRVLMSNA